MISICLITINVNVIAINYGVYASPFCFSRQKLSCTIAITPFGSRGELMSRTSPSGVFEEFFECFLALRALVRAACTTPHQHRNDPGYPALLGHY